MRQQCEHQQDAVELHVATELDGTEDLKLFALIKGQLQMRPVAQQCLALVVLPLDEREDTALLGGRPGGTERMLAHRSERMLGTASSIAVVPGRRRGPRGHFRHCHRQRQVGLPS